MFSKSPNGDDGLWPHEAIREIIEEVVSEGLESGIHVGIRNGRGPTTRAVGEGGKQERALAERYRKYAQALGDAWPRTSRLLTSVADSYAEDARREDTRVELNEELWATRRPIRPSPRLVDSDEAGGLKVQAIADDPDD